MKILVAIYSSFAVWNASRTVARPVSKTASNAITETRMARMVSKMAFLSMAHGPSRG